MSYRETLNLPRTEFPMRANLPELEVRMQRLWADLELYRHVQRQSAGRPRFVLHDGPPYSNGAIHLGQALQKILKDIVVKYKTMRGYDAPFVPGWDNHGLPVEMQAISEFSIDRRALEPMALRRRCAETARHYVEVQKAQFQRLGVRGDWARAYLTMDPQYEATTLEVFQRLVERGLIYRGLKSVHWCPECETALADAELEYDQARSLSVWVKFPLLSAPAGAPGPMCASGIFVLIWTTTPWTLPANAAVALHPEFEYALVDSEGERLLLAAELVGATMLALARPAPTLLASARGRDLEGGLCQHPFVERQVPIVLADYVTPEQGTGCVHTAPGHGPEDFETGRKYGLPIIQPLDERGVFGPEGGKFAGLRHTEADEAIVQELREQRMLLKAEPYSHSYPHCWRCHSPVIFRATQQWFMAVDRLAPAALEAIEGVTWVPTWGRERIRNMVAERPDWCLSRQRAWGVPIPAFYCRECGQVLLEPKVIAHITKLVREHGSDTWFQRSEGELLPPGTACAGCAGTGFRREGDTFDVWFESSSSHAAVLETRPELGWPADLYLEGHDQHRGWFQLSLWNALGWRDQAPYRAVVTTGFVLDEQGRKMSKSLGNVVDPQDIVQRYGADILRLWVTYVDFREDIFTSERIFAQVTEGYRRLRNTLRFLLMNLYDSNPGQHLVPYADLPEVDRWALHRLAEVIARTTRAYEEFELHRVYHTLHTFCAVDLSQFYLDVLKDRLYTSAPDSPPRRSAQTVLHHLASCVARMLAPILSHTCEEVWQHLRAPQAPPSIQLLPWPQAQPEWADDELGARWERLLAVRGEVTKALEAARASGLIRSSLEAEVTLSCAEDDRALLASLSPDLAALLIVSAAHVEDALQPGPPPVFHSRQLPGLAVHVSPAPGDKCERCWLRLPSVGQDGQHPALCHRCLAVLKQGRS